MQVASQVLRLRFARLPALLHLPYALCSCSSCIFLSSYLQVFFGSLSGLMFAMFVLVLVSCLVSCLLVGFPRFYLVLLGACAPSALDLVYLFSSLFKVQGSWKLPVSSSENRENEFLSSCCYYWLRALPLFHITYKHKHFMRGFVVLAAPLPLFPSCLPVYSPFFLCPGFGFCYWVRGARFGVTTAIGLFVEEF